MSKISELSDGGSLQSTDYLIAVRSGGNVKVQADGNLSLGALTLTGLTVNGAVEATGYLSVEGTTGNTGLGTDRWIGGDGTAGTWFYNVPTGSNHYFGVNNSNILAINSTGIDVTGTVTADGLTVEKSGAVGATINRTTSSGATVAVQVVGSTVGTLGSDTGGNGRFDISSVSGGASSDAVQISHTGGTPSALFASNGDISFYEDTGTTPKLFWDASAESLGIGTTSPSGKLSVNLDGSTELVTLRSSSGRQLWAHEPGGNARPLTIKAQTLTYADDTSTRLIIDSSGNLLVGTTSVQGKLAVKQTGLSYNQALTLENHANSNRWSFLYGASNELYLGYNAADRGYFNASTGAYTAVSDSRLKKNIADISYGLNEILALRSVSYNMNEQDDSEVKTLGFIAQEAMEVIPESVSEMMGGMYGMDKVAIVPVLVKAIQEQQEIINDLRARVAQLEGV